MKILYFHQYFNTPKMSGGIRSYQIARSLIEAGHEVTMIASYKKGLGDLRRMSENRHEGEIDGIRVIAFDVPYSNGMGLFKRSAAFLKFCLLALRPVLSEDYDLLYSTSTPLTAGIPGIACKLFRRGKKFVFEVRDLWPELPKAMGLKNPLALWGMSVLEWLSYRCADACVGLSPGIVEGIRRRSPRGRKIALFPNFSDTELFAPHERGITELEEISSKDFVAVFTGAHGRANGLDALLNVAEELKKRGREDIKLAFIGDGKLKKPLEEDAKARGLSNCLFFNPVAKTQLAEIMAKADAGLMVLDNIPAFYYGTSPNKFFDYIACGLPVITNYPGWVADLVAQNSCGFGVGHSDAAEFADKLCFLADNPQTADDMRRRARALAQREFSKEKIVASLVDFLSSVAL